MHLAPAVIPFPAPTCASPAPPLLERLARSGINLLLVGETGSGKEVLAGRIHALSSRSDKPFLRLNCAAFTESLLESELFGHERGAFTGATQVKPGLLEIAHQGTVLLDEIGELPAPLQAKLLRVIEEKTVRRVGGLRDLPIDVRFIAATHRDLDAEIRAGRFRADLFYRLNGFAVAIPPLRQRVDEIELLARRFAAEVSRADGLAAAPPLTAEALEVLRRHDWPGNVRELRNVVHRAVLLSGGAPITPAHVPLGPRGAALDVAGFSTEGAPTPAPAPDEKQKILEALRRCAGNQTSAARAVGVSRRTLITKMIKYGIARPRCGVSQPASALV